MKVSYAVEALSALAQETRLRVFRLLISYGKTGVRAGKIANKLDIPHNTLSFHLADLSKAGLVSSRKDGRMMIYKANLNAANELIGFLIENCCAEEDAENCFPDLVGKKKKKKDKPSCC